ncbi:primosomal protein N' [Sulfurimonas sp.]|uniref:primosomal protein N' n=1 Tax=Sulfurimonas sp. TaxID=2022749 RepID=UPI002AB01CAE|nr:primosomal protein N' [Sulfurimonas sp.]
MYFYEVSILSSPLNPLTYHFSLSLEIGTIVNVVLRNKEVKATIISKCEKPEFKTIEILSESEFFYSLKQMALAKFISTYYVCSLGEALGVMTAFSRSISPEMERTYINSSSSTSPEVELTLSSKQTKALDFLKQHKTSLLFGDTGSGKTEIYMKYFQEIIASGKRCIFLMPEISLTPQMSQRLEEHFGTDVIMWHSKLTALQKKKALKKIYDGSAKIVAGPRSTLFLPINDLGLIVVDEEHDDSYKSSSRPRYNAKDIAIYMGKLHDIPVVLGSATPSLNSFVKFPYFRLKGGFFSAKKEFIYEKSSESLSPLIMEHLASTIKAKNQAIVFVPTRANFKYLICEDCGHTAQCVFCSIGMSIHQKSRALKCHYCNFTQAIPQICSECKGASLISSRLGTVEAIKLIQEQLTDAKIEQFDRDAITTANKLKKALKRFNERETDMLVGTQMLSKGHDYHGVTLAVVLGLDNMLNMSDYRAREKALSCLIQVSGRSGRAKDAKVLIQSFNEEFFSTFIDDYEAFLQEEKIFRVGLYPPYKKLCRVLFSHKNGAKAQEEMREMKDDLVKISNIEVVGFGKCGVERIANKYRFEILLRSDKSTDIIKAVSRCKTGLAEIDMDPIEFG